MSVKPLSVASTSHLSHALLCLSLMLVLFLAGCASMPVYDPVQSATKQTFILNESALRGVQVGMKQDEVHNQLGQELIIGYSYQNNDMANPQPITLPNPYKTVPSQKNKDCTIEYYATAVRQPDGIVSDDELMPLLFCKGVLTAKGWDQVQ